MASPGENESALEDSQGSDSGENEENKEDLSKLSR